MPTEPRWSLEEVQRDAIQNNWWPPCETCGGTGWIVVGQTWGWPYGEQNQCPDCPEEAFSA